MSGRRSSCIRSQKGKAIGNQEPKGPVIIYQLTIPNDFRNVIKHKIKLKDKLSDYEEKKGYSVFKKQ